MDTLFMTADEVAKELNVSKAYAYKVIQRMNKELDDMGYYTVSGNHFSGYGDRIYRRQE